ncbi:mobilization protein [Listeria welshimeri]|uniref:plasmid mobilization protein n=1 Tax=Listeria welshimeri TaxID=1643 RepID=UPI00162920A9|nr:mobilization protein [Listeria welshimeri]EHR7112089.1 mobilization protein [Listeria monocytogenes]MBC1679655.1 mobilization protein [Listeria welshimeri]MBC1960122.1 mobilization protein [Listeria welshimeri]MBF2508708.1 mobilization protein [Listeria welshimeri]MBF2601570.1 mobilization protein [Listeria welshimeri]
MSVKTLDGKGRWRNKIVAFRVSPEENEHLNKLVKLSGLNKQEYLIHRILMEEITVNYSPRVFKAFRNQINEFSELLKDTQPVDKETAELMAYTIDLLQKFREE